MTPIIEQLEAEKVALKLRLASLEKDVELMNLADENRRLRLSIEAKEHRRVFCLCAAAYNTTADELLGRTRAYPIAEARQLAMFIFRRQGIGVVQVGILFNRDHGTVSYAVRAVERRLRWPKERERINGVLAAFGLAEPDKSESSKTDGQRGGGPSH